MVNDYVSREELTFKVNTFSVTSYMKCDTTSLTMEFKMLFDFFFRQILGVVKENIKPVVEKLVGYSKSHPSNSIS